MSVINFSQKEKKTRKEKQPIQMNLVFAEQKLNLINNTNTIFI